MKYGYESRLLEWNRKKFLTVPRVFIYYSGGIMDNAALGKLYINAIENNKIESSTLTKVPELVTCGDWSRVEIIGMVSYVSERTKISYAGVLVKYSGGLYYMRKKLTEALGQIDKRFRNIKNQVDVINS
jgi:hypothetical protein